jgi:hypothetical protein
MPLVPTGTAAIEAGGVPLWFQANFFKQQQKPEEDRHYAAFGRFIAAYAMAEAGVHIAARFFSGMPEEKARVVFSGMRLGDVFDRLSFLAAGTPHQKEVDSLIVHMQDISDARDQFVHRLVEYQHGRGLAVTNRLTSASGVDVRPRIFARSELEDMEQDCRLIFARFVFLCGARDDVSITMAGVTLLGLAMPWRYKLPRPKKPKKPIPSSRELRKRRRRAFRGLSSP